MRLWHKDLIPYLPKQQLLRQWRECCLIAKNIAEKGMPNHILVNRIMDHSIDHFWAYGNLVRREMKKRGYKYDFEKFNQYFENGKKWSKGSIPYPSDEFIFYKWHDRQYFVQCYFNLEEKYYCGDGITYKELRNIQEILLNGRSESECEQ